MAAGEQEEQRCDRIDDRSADHDRIAQCIVAEAVRQRLRDAAKDQRAEAEADQVDDQQEDGGRGGTPLGRRQILADQKSAWWGKSESVRVDLGGLLIIKK